MVRYVITANVVKSNNSKNPMMATDTISSRVNLRATSSISASVGDIASHVICPSSSRTIEQYGSSRYILLLMRKIGLVNTHCWVRLRISSTVLPSVVNSWLWKMTSWSLLSSLQSSRPPTRNVDGYSHWHSWVTALETALDMSEMIPVEFAACSQM